MDFLKLIYFWNCSASVPENSLLIQIAIQKRQSGMISITFLIALLHTAFSSLKVSISFLCFLAICFFSLGYSIILVFHEGHIFPYDKILFQGFSLYTLEIMKLFICNANFFFQKLVESFNLLPLLCWKTTNSNFNSRLVSHTPLWTQDHAST